MRPADTVLEADLTWSGGRFESGVRVTVDPGGMIQEVNPAGTGPASTRRLEGVALLPGFVNAHSHAFQRGLRGLGERFPRGSGSFWSWREQMYELVQELDQDRLYRLSLQCFREMLAAGITCVGEFHYLHHGSEAEDYGLDPVVLQAAADSGIRLVLLQAYYRMGGFGVSLGAGQKRFHTPSPTEYWRQMDRLETMLDPASQGLGAVVHSVRAAPIEEIVEIHQEARRRGLVFHIHVEEQPQELEQCQTHYGLNPLALLQKELTIDQRFTAVHCTHSSEDQLESLQASGANACVCPLTEANLGDGIPNLPAGLPGGGNVSLGSDSNARISFLEEMRWLEYVQRLQRERRGVWVDDEGSVARRLLKTATEGGARSLGLPAGRIEAGCTADFVAVDLSAPELEGWTPENLLDCVMFGGENSTLQAVYVAGRRVYSR